MMYTNLIWMWGHPEVYILVLPAFGVFTRSSRPSAASRSPAIRPPSGHDRRVGIRAVGLAAPLLHHGCRRGRQRLLRRHDDRYRYPDDRPVLPGSRRCAKAASASRRRCCGSWVHRPVRDRRYLRRDAGFPPVDFQVHNSLFLVAHFHSNVIGGVLFGIFAGINYWFPKFAGFRLNERIGRYAFWCWIVGFCLSFIPMYILGLMGATRRLDHYDASTGWQPLLHTDADRRLVIAIGGAADRTDHRQLHPEAAPG
jgi:cytochrome o ubiquinol oxidase subunit 1